MCGVWNVFSTETLQKEMMHFKVVVAAAVLYFEWNEEELGSSYKRVMQENTANRTSAALSNNKCELEKIKLLSGLSN